MRRDPSPALSDEAMLEPPACSATAAPTASSAASSPPNEADDPAEEFRRMAAVLYLHGSFTKPLQNAVPPAAIEAYLAGVLRDAGEPRDPIERMLIEQSVLAHHHLGHLYLRAGSATDAQELEAILGAAARLLGEFRRTALALRSYREPAASPKVLVAQQNIAAGDQQVAYLAAGAGEAPPLPRKKPSLDELPAQPLEILDHGSPDRQLPVLEGDGREAAEETRPAQRRRSRTASAGHDGS